MSAALVTARPVFGLPQSCGWVAGRPVYFEAVGLPCTADQVRAGLVLVEVQVATCERKAAEYAAAAQTLRAAAVDRRAILACLEALGDAGE